MLQSVQAEISEIRNGCTGGINTKNTTGFSYVVAQIRPPSRDVILPDATLSRTDGNHTCCATRALYSKLYGSMDFANKHTEQLVAAFDKAHHFEEHAMVAALGVELGRRALARNAGDIAAVYLRTAWEGAVHASETDAGALAYFRSRILQMELGLDFGVHIYRPLIERSQAHRPGHAGHATLDLGMIAKSEDTALAGEYFHEAALYHERAGNIDEVMSARMLRDGILDLPALENLRIIWEEARDEHHDHALFACAQGDFETAQFHIDLYSAYVVWAVQHHELKVQADELHAPNLEAIKPAVSAYFSQPTFATPRHCRNRPGNGGLGRQIS